MVDVFLALATVGILYVGGAEQFHIEKLGHFCPQNGMFFGVIQMVCHASEVGACYFDQHLNKAQVFEGTNL